MYEDQDEATVATSGMVGPLLREAEAYAFGRIDSYVPSPLNRIPTTEQEALENLAYRRDPMTASVLQGIFRCRMMQEETILSSYLTALEAHIKASNKFNS